MAITLDIAPNTAIRWMKVRVIVMTCIIEHTIITGWWLTYPSEKYEFVSWDDDISDIWKKRNHVPNHQPEIVHRIRPRCIFLYKLLDVRWFILITHSGCNPSVCLAMKSPSFFLQSRENPRTGPGFTLNLLQGSKYEQPYGCMMANLQPEDSTWKKNAGSPFKELHQKSLQG